MKQHNTRLMKGALTLLTIAMLTFTGCKKDDDASPSGSKTILKYELLSTVPFQVVSPNNYSVSATYTNGLGVQQQEYSTVTGKTWTKTVELTATQRPVAVSLWSVTGYTSGLTGTITANIYENDVLKVSKDVNIMESGLQDSVGAFLLLNLYYLKQE